MPAAQIAANNDRDPSLVWDLTGNATGYNYTTSPAWRLVEPGGLPLGVMGYKAALVRGGVVLVHAFVPVGPSPSEGTSETATLKDPQSSGTPNVAVAFQRLTGGSAYTRVFLDSIDTKSQGFNAGTTLIIYQVRF